MQKIQSFRISLTNICNYNCFFCHNEGLSKENMKSYDDIFLKGINILSNISSELNINRFSITGGEPLLNKNIFKILDTIKKGNNNSLISLSSNSFLLNKKIIRKLSKYIYKININFQSINNKNFEKITGVDGLEKIFKNIDLLKESGIEVGLNMVYTSKNKDEVQNIISYVGKKGIQLKILELVKDKNNIYYYKSLDDLKNKLLSNNNFYKITKISGSEDRFYLTKDSYIRLIYSYCNKFDSKTCAKHGEIRVSNTFDINHCLISNFKSINILDYIKNNDVEKIKLIINDIESNIGICPIL